MIPLHRFPRLHLVGVGGAGMAPLAGWLAARGFHVSGSDRAESANLEWLRDRGVDARVGHAAESVEGVSLVVRSSAIGPDNPEVRHAVELGIPVVRRAEALGEVTRSGHSLCVAGTHGKTTTTLMLARILRQAGRRPSVLPGGVPANPEDAPDPSCDGPLVVESDEFDRTFLSLHPDVAVVTNLEEDHLDCYRDLADLETTFAAFLARLPFHGYAVLCADDPGAAGLAAGCAAPVFTYGLDGVPDYRGTERPDGSVEVAFRGSPLCLLRLAVPGRHNRRNALAALAVAHREGVDPELAAEALSGFHGAKRRMDRVGELNGCPVFDDYAHHPTEIEATLQAARETAHGRRLLVVFQPHLYSRTRHFAAGFARALSRADLALLAPVYPARETPAQGAESDAILAQAPDGSSLRLLADRGAILDAVRERAAEGGWDILFVGAGDVGSWARVLFAGEKA